MTEDQMKKTDQMANLAIEPRAEIEYFIDLLAHKDRVIENYQRRLVEKEMEKRHLQYQLYLATHLGEIPPNDVPAPAK